MSIPSRTALAGLRRRLAPLFTAGVVCLNTTLPAFGQPPHQPAPVVQAAGTGDFSTEQLDALLAPIALYPDQLLTQLLIAATFPVQIVEASRWVADPAHKDLAGEALANALEPFSWDPSVKSLVPFPQVLSQLDGNLEWMQQLGYAFANQQREVLDSVQRLRRQAQANGHLQSTAQQVVRDAPPATPSAPSVIVIEPAQPAVVYVPVYSPAVVYGTWPYPATPPVVVAPAPGYVAGTALLSGLAFGTGIAISSALWGWSSPNWGRGDVSVNVNRWNNINVNRHQAVSNTWSPTWNRAGGRPANLQRPPGGPVGAPVRNAGLPADAIGRRNVSVPGNLVDRPARKESAALDAGKRPTLTPGSRPAAQNVKSPKTAAQRPQNAQGAQRTDAQALQHRQTGSRQSQPGAFSGINQGDRAAAFGERGVQSRSRGDIRSGTAGSHPASGKVQGGGLRGGSHERRN